MLGKDDLTPEVGNWKCKEDAKSDYYYNHLELFEYYVYDNRGETRRDHSPDEIIVEEYVDPDLYLSRE
jgi:hypothetical protein